ncbi:MAG: hypothetical protein JWL95_808, partial [Gemmatimonadetes bacterium]|nr:hypothetical protein [Gemmatimonadota bacterium]
MTHVLVDAAQPAPMERSTSIRRALLFLFVCSPIWLLPSMSKVGHPAVMAAAVLAVTYLFLRRDGRPSSVLGLDPSWRRLRELAVGFGGGALLILAMALGVRLLLPF